MMTTPIMDIHMNTDNLFTVTETMNIREKT